MRQSCTLVPQLSLSIQTILDLSAGALDLMIALRVDLLHTWPSTRLIRNSLNPLQPTTLIRNLAGPSILHLVGSGRIAIQVRGNLADSFRSTRQHVVVVARHDMTQPVRDRFFNNAEQRWLVDEATPVNKNCSLLKRM